MKVVKGIFIYTMLILGALLIVGIFLLGGMYIFKWPLFGYTFKDINIQTDRYASINPSAYYTGAVEKPRVKFVIDAGGYSVRIMPDAEGSVINYYTVSDFSGFVKSTDKLYTPSVTTVVDVQNVKETVSGSEVELPNIVVNIKIAKPSGLIKFSKDNRIVIVVPEYYAGKKVCYNCDIKTTSGDITLKNSVKTTGEFNAPLRVNSLVASTKSGDILLAGFEKVKQEEDGQEIYVAKSSVELNNLVMSTKSGKFDFSNFKQLTINDKFFLKSEKADYIFETLNAKKGIEISGENILLKATEINCENGDFVYKSESGGIDVGILNCSTYVKSGDDSKYHYTQGSSKKLHNITIFSSNAKIKLGSVIGKTRIENEYGQISIGLMSTQASIKNANGNITITSSGYLPVTDNTTRVYTDTSSMVLYNTYGDITVSEYYQNVLVNNVKGKITLNSKYNAKNDGDFYYSKVTSKDGNIDFTTDGNPYNIVAKDKANITIIQNAVKDIDNTSEDNQVYYSKTANGRVNIYLPTDPKESIVKSGYIVYVDGKLASTPTNTFATLKAKEYHYYMRENNNIVVPEAELESALENYPLIKIASKKAYVYAQV